MGHTLPSNIVRMMECFGYDEFNPEAMVESWQEHGEHCIELFPFASAAPDRFVEDMATAVLPAGGWAVYGASRMIWELLSPSPTSNPQVRQNPAYKAIMDASLAFLRTNGTPRMRVRPYEWDYWLENGGTLGTWIH